MLLLVLLVRIDELLCLYPFFSHRTIFLWLTDKPTIGDGPALLDFIGRCVPYFCTHFLDAISLQLTQPHAAYVSPMTIVHIILHKGIRILAELAL